jgi:hypothetical protein
MIGLNQFRNPSRYEISRFPKEEYSEKYSRVEVVGTAFTFTQPENLPPSSVAPFNLILTSASVPMS